MDANLIVPLGATLIAVIGFFLKSFYNEMRHATDNLNNIWTEIKLIRQDIQNHKEVYLKLETRIEHQEERINNINEEIQRLDKDFAICRKFKEMKQ